MIKKSKKWQVNRGQQGLACVVLWVQLEWLKAEILKMRTQAGKQKIDSMRGAFFFGRADGLMAVHKRIDREFQAFNKRDMRRWIVQVHKLLLGQLIKKPKPKCVSGMCRIKSHEKSSH